MITNEKEAHKVNPLCAPLMLMTVSLSSGLQLLIDNNHGNVKLAINGVWYVKSYDEFIDSFTKNTNKDTE